MSQLPSFAGRTILITGATRGTGLAAASAWHGLGAHVVAGTRHRSGYEEVAARLGHTRVSPFVADMGDDASLDEALAALAGAQIKPTDLVNCAAGGLEPILRPVLRAALAIRRTEPGAARDAAVMASRAEITGLVARTTPAAMKVNCDGARHLIERLVELLPAGARIITLTSTWSRSLRNGQCPAFYRAVAESKNRLEDWLDQVAPAFGRRGIVVTVLDCHLISDTSTAEMIDRYLVPLMSDADQAAMREDYVSTAETVSAMTRILSEAAVRPSAVHRMYLSGSGLSREPNLQSEAIASRVPI